MVGRGLSLMLLMQLLFWVLVLCLCNMNEMFLKYIFPFLSSLRALFLPAICAYCKAFLSEQTIFCTECKNKIFPIVSKNIDITPKVSVTVFALSDYKDPLKKLILAKGWSDTLASYQMGQLLSEMTALQQLDCDVVVPIPLHWTRYAWRGFNQAQEIAHVMSKKKNVPMVCALKRIKKTAFQSTLVANMRVENLKEAFAFNNVELHNFKDKHILLVDDLMTTGSTIHAAVKKLLELKPRKITVAVICRVV
jgi:ComF family protein